MPNTNPTQKLGVCVGYIRVYVGSARLFRYLHVGIGNSKCLRGSNVRGFTFKWKRGYSFITPKGEKICHGVVHIRSVENVLASG